MYDAEMKLNHQIVQFVETQLHLLLPPQTSLQSSTMMTGQNMHLVMMTILAQYLAGLKAIDCLLSKGFTAQTRGIFQTLGDDYEDIIFLSLPSQDGQLTPLHEEYLKGVAGDECHTCYSPISRCEIRNMIKRANSINHNVFQLYPKKQALQILRTHGGKQCSVEVAFMLHRHYAYKALLLTMLTAKIAGDTEIMRACLNYRAHLEMIDPKTIQLDYEAMSEGAASREFRTRFVAVK
ncbi:hypothetical protein [Photobacterium lipolyticum]|uniref:Uncharacterized protein n=1 Tax=Photobacterium lipolyticum TaxID=266810 RepID=A0A2T3MZ42_9GAMM|nr:hypothetical protein [Photobacterium lipolyticum]PSW05129.1 hypothetical protein C9I89_10075 [Photobacterium lipolyticum]